MKNREPKEDSKKEKTVEVELEEGMEEEKDESTSEKEGGGGWKDKKAPLVGIGIFLLIVVVLGFIFFTGSEKADESAVNMSAIKDIGAVTFRGDGLPGYDVNRDGEPDYLSSGFGYYKELFRAGGFDYGPGAIELEEFDVEIILPPLHFQPEDIRESGVGSVVEFTAVDENSTVSVIVILKTLGPSLTTYNLFIDETEGESYSIIDSIGVSGSGTIEVKEVEIAGRVVFRE
jgi:hypothetical protein